MPPDGGSALDALTGPIPAALIPSNLVIPPGDPLMAPAGKDPAANDPARNDPAGAATDGMSSGLKSFFGDVGAKVASAQGAIQAAFGAGQQVASQAAQATQQQSAAIIAASQAKAAVDSSDATQRAKEASDNAAIAAKVGLTGPTEDKTLQNIHDTMDQLNQITPQITKANDVSFWNDPISYLFNQVVKVPILEDQRDTRVENLRAMTTAVSTQAAAMQAGSMATAAVDSVNTAGRAALLTKQDLAQGLADAQEPLLKDAQIKLSALGLAVSSAGELIKSADAQAGLPMKQVQTEYYSTLKEEQLAVQKERLINTANEARLNSLRGDTIEQAETDRTAKLGAINSGLTQFGIKPVTSPGAIPTAQAASLIDMGLRVSQGGGAGSDPLNAVQNILGAKVIDPNNLPAGQPVMFRDILNTENAVRTQIKSNPATMNLKGADLESAVQAGVNQHYKNATSLLFDDPQRQNPLFSPVPLASLRAQPWAKDNPILKAMEPYTIDGNGKSIPNVPTRYQDLFSAAATLVSSGKLTAPQAAAYIKDIANNSLADNDKAYGFRRFAIPVDTSKYNVSLPRPGAIFGGNDAVDLKNNAAVMKYLRNIMTSNDASFVNK